MFILFVIIFVVVHKTLRISMKIFKFSFKFINETENIIMKNRKQNLRKVLTSLLKINF